MTYVSIDTQPTLELFAAIPEAEPHTFRHSTLSHGLPTEPGQLSLATRSLLPDLLARELVGRPVAKDELRLLLEGAQSMQDVRAMLCQGRPNAAPDRARMPDLQLSQLMNATWRVLDEHQPPLDEAEKAGVVAYMQAGERGDYARITQCVHANRLKDGDSVTLYEIVNGLGEDDHHFVAVLESASGVKVVLDSFSNGSPVNLQDYSFDSAGFFSRHRVDAGTGPATAQLFRKGLAQTGPRLHESIMKELPLQAPSSVSVNVRPTVSTGFARQAADEIEAYFDDSGKKHYTTGWVASARSLSEGLWSSKATQDTRLRQQARTRLVNEKKVELLAMKLGADGKTAMQIAPQVVQEVKSLRSVDTSALIQRTDQKLVPV
jgi:hypothetical protein